jgi:hypothetical protein
MTFRAWLRLQRDREDALGDLARDAAQDRRAPRDPERFARYISNHPHACHEARRAARQAVATWRRWAR